MTEQLRRQPSQRRAQDRITKILDAADTLLATDGAAALGTKPVAAAAGVSIGSLYHWFPDKESIAQALALRYWAELADLVDGVAETVERSAAEHRASADPAGPEQDPAAEVLSVLAAGFRARPGFLAMWFSALRTEHLREVTRPTRARVALAVIRILTVTHPDADPELRAKVAAMLALIGDGILREAFRVDRQGDAEILEEGRTALRAYVEARLGGVG
jgi:AcrR family transcriptional regulator